ncbi:hypothetical protein ACFTWG_19455 [Streptomyces albidoflavus]
MVAVFLDSGKRVPKMPSLLAWRVDSLMPTMRAWEPSTAAIIEGAGMIAVAIRSTGPSNRIFWPRWSVRVNPAAPAFTSCRGSREEQAPRAPAPARAAAPAPSPRRTVRRGAESIIPSGGVRGV